MLQSLIFWYSVCTGHAALAFCTAVQRCIYFFGAVYKCRAFCLVFFVFKGYGTAGASCNTGAAHCAVPIRVGICPFISRQRHIGYKAYISAGCALLCNKCTRNAKGAKAAGICGVTFGPAACILQPAAVRGDYSRFSYGLILLTEQQPKSLGRLWQHTVHRQAFPDMAG